MNHSYQNLLPSPVPGTQDQILILRMNRPESANALNTAMATEFRHFFSSLSDSPCRALILTGQGKHFCAGADLKDRKAMDEEAWHAQHHAFEEAHRALLACDIPVIAAVNGAAMGGGLELAMACDFIYAATNARLALTETRLGIMPGLGGTQLLPRKIGYAAAAELIYCARSLNASEAQELRLVNRVLPESTLLDAAIATAQEIAANAPLAVRGVKRAMREGANLSLPEALTCELTHYATLLDTNDRREGINAFNEKRKASFTGS